MVLLARWGFALIAACGACASAVADLSIYDEALLNGFSNTSWGGNENLANTGLAHGGTHSIRFLPTNWDGLRFAHNGALNTSAYRGLVFWVHGGVSGGQQLRLFVANGSTTLAQADIASILGAPVAANVWTRVEVSFDAAPVLVNGTFDNVYIMDWRDGTAQPTVYLDDISLIARVGVPVDAIFSANFEGPPPVAPNGIIIEHAVGVGGYQTDRYTWIDSAGRPRSAAMVRNSQGDPSGHQGGYLRQLTYRLPDNSVRTVTGSFDGHPGFGYVVTHYSDDTGGGADLGYNYAGQYATRFAGRHHAIHRYTQTYPMRGKAAGGGVTTYPVAVTIEWAYFTGRDHPLWAISYDLSAAPVNAINADSRSPYGDMTYDGANDTVMGVAWGERYKFTSTGGPLTRNSSWTWNASNTVPYALQWTQNVDAEMGLVSTQTIVQQDAGGYWGYDRWNSTSASGAACAGSGYTMPCDWNWPYQLNQYSFLGTSDTTTSKRMAWGTNFGFLGQSSYAEMGMAANRSGYPRQSYSLQVVLDRHSISPSLLQMGQVEVTQNTTLSASVGSVLTQGPAGVNRTDTRLFQPAGYNPVFGTWDVQAAGNAAMLNLTIGSGSLRNPIVVLHGYTNVSLPSSVKLGGTTLLQDVDYFPSVDTAAHELWITLNRNLSGTNALTIAP
ncbi:MAG: hypothetical protein ABI411_05275 [Tahibacter sp.]